MHGVLTLSARPLGLMIMLLAITASGAVTLPTSARAGQVVAIDVWGRKIAAEVVKKPFYKKA